jgi:CheY-like chemotaxis protein
MIADAGFDVVEAASADEAIVILEDRFDITVVFSDIQMPGGGAERPPYPDQDIFCDPLSMADDGEVPVVVEHFSFTEPSGIPRTNRD